MFNANYFVQYESHKRELLIVSENNKGNCADSDNNEEKDDNMFNFVRSIPNDVPATKSRISEV